MRMIIPFLAFCLVATCNAELRTWTAVNGKEVEAEFVSNEKGIVKLKLKSGKVFTVPLNKLSKEDQDFIKSKPFSFSLDKPLISDEEVKRFSKNAVEFTFQPDDWEQRKKYTGWTKGDSGEELEHWKDGKPDGRAMGWYESGKIEYMIIHKEGAQVQKHIWYENGQKLEEVITKENGAQEARAWHKNGKKALEVIFKSESDENPKFKYWNNKGEPVDSIEETGINAQQ